MSFDSLTTLIGGQDGIDLETAGPACRALAAGTGEDTQRARALIATMALQALAHSPAFQRALTARGFPFHELARTEQIVALRSVNRRYDLVMLHSLRDEQTWVIDIKPSSSDLIEGWLNFTDLLEAPPPFHTLGPLIAIEAFAGQPFGAVIAQRPTTSAVNAPPSVWKVDPLTGSYGDSTAGVAAIDKKKRSGVTAALHAVGSNKHVTVDGVSGTVVRRNKVSDSCFIEVTTTANPGSKGAKGPLANKLPRGNQGAEYEGLTTGLNSTNVTGWDLAAPNVTKYNQLKIYTPPITDQGDSGAALISDDDYIVGFALEVTGRNATPAYSSWVWAHSVYELLDLEY
ncbi:hypothetical protein [Aliidongia dinghuensis]|nr:hypothetical protein [Aliidongia dinghuensis]